MYYPIIFKPIYKEVVWGGDRLKTLFGRTDLPSDKTGETWDISQREGEMSVCANGKYKGLRFSEIIDKNPEGMLGTGLDLSQGFPLLIKIIDASDNLSLQVHPGDEYAQKNENYPFGKTEAWYVLEAPKDGKLIIGLKDGISRADFLKAAEEGSLMGAFSELEVKKGDIINIPAGLLHAITAGTVIAEIQQNSDITYRVYDYDRLGLDGNPRALHMEKAVDVLDFSGKIRKEALVGLSVKTAKLERKYYIANEYFTLLTEEISTEASFKTDPESFICYTCVDGEGAIETADFSQQIRRGDSIFIPAAMGDYKIRGNIKLIKSSLISGRKTADDLLAAGFTEAQIRQNTAIDF